MTERAAASAIAPVYQEKPSLPQLSLHSPLGALTISAEDDAIVALDWGWGRDQTPTPLLQKACDQMHAYLDGERAEFELPLRPHGSRYQLRVWTALRSIPFGQTRTYAELALDAGGCARSIGGANRSNPLPIIIPCHRVVAANGIGGFSGGEGLDTKRFLLSLEAGMATRGRVPGSSR